MHKLSSYLNGSWQQGTGRISTLHNALTGEPMAETSTEGLNLQEALEFGRKSGGSALRALSFLERGELLSQMSKIVREHRDELIEMAADNMGATRGDAKFDIDGASGTLAYYAHLAQSLGDRRVLTDGDQVRISRSKRFVGQHIWSSRRGVAVHINAFNFPAWNMAEKVACALLAGVPVLCKPGTATALIAHRVAQLWVEHAGLPAGAFQLLCGSAGDLLDHLERQDCVVFTGSNDTASLIRNHPRIREMGIAVNVEADSLNAAVLGPDVQTDSDTFLMFIAEVVREMVQKAGQKCTAIRRILIPRATLDDALEVLRDRLDQQVIGDPRQRATTVGALSTPAQKRDVLAGIEALQNSGATRIWGDPQSAPETGFFVAPQLFLAEGGAAAPYVHEHEVFGPVATILPYDGTVAEATEIVAQGGGGLVSSLFSDDSEWGQELLLELAPWHGRLLWGSAKIHDQSTGHGAVMPGLIHGGPGKAGGGSELGGERGLWFYMQRTAIQGDSALLRRAFTNPAD
ncbi:MAG TPA: 3,4-dehydroadipyl-CoA semialdehyde dehydrogenase [Myxococcales bacterium]|nr:aldehyde dehydrogenase [Myxococcales bacterium]HAN31294.1 3,4-dehydroadipyl-CoA semialdehyde dehydrogenase [Myxococcales bacterium]